MSSTELSLIDSGIESLNKIPLSRHVKVVNLHCNHIRQIENLQVAPNLVHLDLSSNQIAEIKGLDAVLDLRTLNLSCNQISKAQGLCNLRSLVHLNLSYNKIVDITGLRGLPELNHLNLCGNRITRIDDITNTLTDCLKLRELLLRTSNSNSNTVCNHPNYRRAVLHGLRQLSALDGLNKEGVAVTSTNPLHTIPGLEDWIDILNTESPSVSVQSTPLVTPKIDQLLTDYRSRSRSSDGYTSVSMETVGTSDGRMRSLSEVEPTDDCVAVATQDIRLKSLEDKIAQLMSEKLDTKVQEVEQATDKGTSRSLPSAISVTMRPNNKRENEDTDTSENIQEEQTTVKGQRARKGRATLTSKKSNSRPRTKSKSKESSASEPKRDRSCSRSPSRRQLSPSVVVIGDGIRSRDSEQKQELESTYVQLMNELETERERRWKSEQSLKKLADHTKHIQNRANEDLSVQHTAIEATAKLKSLLSNERDAKMVMQNEMDSLKAEIEKLATALQKSRDHSVSSREGLESLRDCGNRQEAEHVKQHILEAKKTQEAQLKAAALHRELDIIKSSAQVVKTQLHQTQELLSNREQEHRDEMKGRFTLESPELKDVVERELRKAEKAHSSEISSMKERLHESRALYTDLENEFRQALQIEAARYNEVHTAYNQCTDAHSLCRKTLSELSEKESRSSKLIAELTAMVKEQKGRITELVKAKQEQSAAHKDRVQYLEAHVDEARKRMIQFELLKKEKNELEAEFQAKESVVQGLRAERKIWGKELAQQGSSLAQDRGRMEAKIETLTSDVATLKIQLERDADAIKIKTKIIEDQTESIRKLKEAVIEREVDIKKLREETLQQQQLYDEQLSEEKAISHDLHDSLERSKVRKEELKDQLASVEAELENSKKLYASLQNKWREKSDLIGQLERQVITMRDTWDTKHTNLTDERDAALKAAREAAEKLRAIDDAFRAQLDGKESAHQETLLSKDEAHLRELASAQQRVVEVEEEMRELLKDIERSKRDNDAKIKKLTDVFAELQTVHT